MPLRRRGGGSILDIGSIEGIGANPWHAAYCSSKTGVHGFTRAMAADLGHDGIRCNAIAPGWIKTHSWPSSVKLPSTLLPDFPLL
ncbi:hypothetical protein GCM10011348_12470 [Marinobacterium nitratireducens]|uniref:Uncharacterized protein n=1 Tax=Marinobacterium nitratireducens TaxID=518897 RepID=A0A918DQ02_9GAMM|nr:SDR family oxidoreductase [Marinobacterium nitratireducens]GGO79075.1 hypothetical protein GCM10011348_12470 [Marinobacterium nitratireducens]